MKKIANLTLIILLASLSSYGQIDMGDAELNTWLTAIVKNAKVNFSGFRHNVIANYGVTNNRYDYLETFMTVGDIYMAVEITKVSKKSLDDVIASFKANKAKGWGAIAKDFGVTPGSSSFESLKDHAYKMANGTDRPKPKPVVASKPKPAAKPATKSTSKSKQSTKTKSTTKPKTTTKPATTKPKAKN